MSFFEQLPTNRGFDVVGFGLNAVDHLITVPHYPAFNTKVRFLDHRVLPGGQVATAMVGLARLGMRTRYIGQVGDDDEGRLQVASLRDEGVETALVQTIPGAKSQVAFIIVDQESGERTIIWDRDERLQVDPTAVTREMIQCARVLHLDGHEVRASIRAAELAREAGMPVVIDVDNLYPGIEGLLPMVTFLIASAKFPSRVTGEAGLTDALLSMQRQFGNPMVAVTLGSEGVVALCDGKWLKSPAFQVACRDTTGAGDAFRAGFIYGLLQNFSLEETLRVANAVAGLNCTGLGGRGGLPTREKLDQFLRDQLGA